MKDQDALLASPLFAGFSVSELQKALDALSAVRRAYPRGEAILCRGERAGAVGLLAAGSASVVREDFWGNRDILAKLLPGDLFAESYVCADLPLGVSVVADEDSAAVFLDLGSVLGNKRCGCGLQSRLIQNLLEVLARKNLLMSEKLAHVTQRATRDKLLSYLSAESLRRRADAFDIPFDRQQLADYLAVDRSALSAELSRLRKQGLLEFRKNHFRLCAGAAGAHLE